MAFYLSEENMILAVRQHSKVLDPRTEHMSLLMPSVMFGLASLFMQDTI